MEYVPEYPIGSILYRPCITEDYIFIYCPHKTGLLQYTRDGKFIRRIGANGRGPGEYLGIKGGFTVDPKRGFINFLPLYKDVIYKYDYKTGKYLGNDIEIPDYFQKNFPESIYPLSDQVIYVNVSPVDRIRSPRYNEFFVMDMNTGKILYEKESSLYGLENLGFEKRVRSGVGSWLNTIWYDSQGRVNCLETLADTAYSFDSDFTLRPRFIIDYGSSDNYKLDVETAVGAFSPFLDKIHVKSIYESDHYLFFWLSLKGEYLLLSYDKMDGNQYLLARMGEEEYEEKGHLVYPFNDIDGGIGSLGEYDKDLWFTSYRALSLKNLLTPEHFGKVKSKVKYPDRMEKLQKLVSGLKEEDNPVIVIGHLKK